VTLFVLAWILAVLATPAQHGDFDHYTFALTWQPGICSTDPGCRADQPRTPLIGLHGLWASLPSGLAATGVVDPQWWSKGCDYYHHSDDAPALDPSLQARLDAVMPHFTHSLLTHEYDKHVQCFGFDPEQFFSTALAMHDAVASSSFGTFLVGKAGQRVRHDDVVAQFTSTFGAAHPTALQLQCAKNAAGEEVLTQFWFQIPTNQINAFPQPQSFMDTPTNEDTCPPAFLIPAW
jgi:ribonuclease I (enterobacter ribonuclease)